MTLIRYIIVMVLCECGKILIDNAIYWADEGFIEIEFKMNSGSNKDYILFVLGIIIMLPLIFICIWS